MIPFVLVAATVASASQVEEYRVLSRTREVMIVCPKLRTTRVVLPERVTGYRGEPTAEAALGFQIQTRPQPVITVHPTRHPFEARFRVDGVTRPLVLVFRTVAAGEPRELRLVLATSAVPRVPAQPSRASAPRTDPGKKAQAATPEPPGTADGSSPRSPSRPSATGIDKTSSSDASELAAKADAHDPIQSIEVAPAERADEIAGGSGAVTPSQPPAPASFAQAANPNGLLDPGILTARVRSIGRVESLPGQRPVELVDVLEGGRHVWLRFSVGDAKGVRVHRVWWEHGAITTYAVEEVDKGQRLALVVQLPRQSETGTTLITKRTRVHLKLSDGERKFSLNAPWLGAVVKDLFGW